MGGTSFHPEEEVGMEDESGLNFVRDDPVLSTHLGVDMLE